MKINTFIQSQVKKDYFFLEGFCDIDTEYFIDKIKEGIHKEGNRSFRTNVHGGMTDWTYFLNDPKFWEVMWPIMNELEKIMKLRNFKINEVWGLEEAYSGRTKEHELNQFLGELPELTCHRSKIGQVVTNLLANAADALSEKSAGLRESNGERFRG